VASEARLLKGQVEIPMVAVHGKPREPGRRKPLERNSLDFIGRVRSTKKKSVVRVPPPPGPARALVLTGVLKIVPVERGPERVSRVRLVSGHTAVLAERVDRLIPPYRAVGHTDFLAVVRDRRAR